MNVMLRDVKCEDYSKDCVRSAGLAVHVCGGHGPRLVALLHQLAYLQVIRHRHGSQALNIRAKNIMFPVELSFIDSQDACPPFLTRFFQ